MEGWKISLIVLGIILALIVIWILIGRVFWYWYDYYEFKKHHHLSVGEIKIDSPLRKIFSFRKKFNKKMIDKSTMTDINGGPTKFHMALLDDDGNVIAKADPDHLVRSSDRKCMFKHQYLKHHGKVPEAELLNWLVNTEESVSHIKNDVNNRATAEMPITNAGTQQGSRDDPGILDDVRTTRTAYSDYSNTITDGCDRITNNCDRMLTTIGQIKIALIEELNKEQIEFEVNNGTEHQY